VRYFIIAGEASGDLHGSGLVTALRESDPEAEIQAWGGDNMAEAGADIVKHYRELAFMGFVEVARNILTIIRNFKRAKRNIDAYKADALILIDYPGFNLRMASWAHEKGIPVHYYISPQLWAWKESRVEKVRKYVDKMYVILPFEKKFYKQHGIDVRYVGHPLLESIDRYVEEHPEKQNEKDRIAILAGSRQQEIRHMLPVMLEVASRFPKNKFCIAAAPHVPGTLYTSMLNKSTADNVEIVEGDTYGVLQRSIATMTTSGTATLETALFGIPQVVCYKGNQLSFAIARRLVKVPFISLVNLIAGKPVVEELIQENMNPAKLSTSLQNILSGDMRSAMLNDYGVLRQKLDMGGASRHVADEIYNSIKD
jgi:lipid-A-disaccharide synthase